MRKIRGFKIGKRLVRVTRWIIRKTRGGSGYQRLGAPDMSCECKSKPISKLISWGRRLTNGAKSLCLAKPASGYVPMDQDPIREKPVSVPKGYLAVYVGQKDGDFHRVLVPVIYFNHPLFGKLLRDAEEEYGFNQQGGITIPCRFSEFEQVQTRIAAGNGARTRKLTWKRNHWGCFGMTDDDEHNITWYSCDNGDNHDPFKFCFGNRCSFFSFFLEVFLFFSCGTCTLI